jgi:hypothetical protein
LARKHGSTIGFGLWIKAVAKGKKAAPVIDQPKFKGYRPFNAAVALMA